MVTKTSNLIKSMKGQVQKQTPIASEMFLPNHSGISSHPEFKEAIDSIDLSLYAKNIAEATIRPNANATYDLGLDDAITQGWWNNIFTTNINIGSHGSYSTLARDGFYLSCDSVFKAPRIEASIADGTAPLIITSTTLNTNLNADLLDGSHASTFVPYTGATGNVDIGVYDYKSANGTSSTELKPNQLNIGISTNNTIWQIEAAQATGDQRLSMNCRGNSNAPLYLYGYLDTTRVSSRVATGTSPYACTSTTLNTNLNADLLDGQHAAEFLTAEADTWATVIARGNTLADNVLARFGTGNDSSISFDGNSLNIIANTTTSTDALELTAGSMLFTLGGTATPPRMLTAGTSNIFLGYFAGNTAASGNTDNIGIGTDSLQLITSGDGNIAIGTGTLKKITTISALIAIGNNALWKNTSSPANVAIGYASGYNITNSAGGNTLVGYYTAGHPNAGNIAGCTLVGSTAGYQVAGNNNTMIGCGSGYTTTSGENNIYLGPNSGYRMTTESNQLLIDNQDRGSVAGVTAKSLIYGTFNATVASQQLTINAGTLNFNAGTNTDLTINFTGTTNSGLLNWMEDEDYFKFSDDILMNSTEKIYFNDTSSYIYDDGTDLLLTSNGTIKTSQTIDAGGYRTGANIGVSGSFTTADVPAKTVTVTNGIITSIV